jgi:glycosyltransferase involved in cell wall biosynthesis
MRYLIIPCYNEEARLKESEVLKCVNTLDAIVVLVNDGSNDSTLALLNRISSFNSDRVKVLDLEKNVGKGEAIRAGFGFAISNRATEVGFCDADFAVDSRDLARIFGKLTEDESVCGVIGSRVAVAGSTIQRSRIRHYSGRVFATFAAMVLSQKIYDTQCGAKAFRVNHILETCFSIPFQSRWAFDVEIIGRINRLSNGQNCSIVELPLLQWIDQPGSKLTMFSRVVTVVELVKIWRSLKSWKSL